MTVRIQAESEPIPGYRLIERIGGGGFGEVWKCEAPGGLLKAIKIVHGDLGHTEEEANRAEQELKALKRVQSVRHPYLLSLERYDIVEGRLLIVMELADCNLWDRFLVCRKERSLPGIPRDDLLRYMAEAAEVLDLMNTQHQLQHLDIKPQNLFLIHDHVKVADFGLVKDLEGVRAAVTGGVTPVYAAPETFDGIVTRFCDQYSLAIVYQELLTGQRPFLGQNIQQLIMQHLRGTPNLSAVPASDRVALMRALAKKPEERWPSCMALVKALQHGSGPPGGGSAGGGHAGNTPVETPGAGITPTPTPSQTRPPVSPPLVLPGLGAFATNPSLVLTPATQLRVRREELPNAPAEPVVPRLAPPELTGPGCLMPSLVVGLGQGGLAVLHRLRQHLSDRFGPAEKLPSIRLLYVDTDPESLAAATGGPPTMALSADEIFPAKLKRAGEYLRPRRNGRSLIEGWFDQQMLYRIPRNLVTLGVRCMGRLAFCDHFRLLSQRIKQELEACVHPDALGQTDRHTRLGLRTNRPRVYLATSLGGGTGSGMFIDLAYSIRHRLRWLGYENPDVVGLLLLPPAERNANRQHALGNAFAALRELNHFSRAGSGWSGQFDAPDGNLADDQPPFTRFFLLAAPPAGTQAGPMSDPARLAAEALARELTTPLGRALDDRRALQPTEAEPAGSRKPAAGHTFGLARIAWPRQVLLDEAARRVCLHVLNRWSGTEPVAGRAAVATWVAEQWAAQQLGADALIQRLQSACEKAAGQVPEALFQSMTEPFVPKGFWSRPQFDRAAVVAVLGQMEALVGSPVEMTLRRTPGQFADVLGPLAERLLKEMSVRLGQLAVCLIEQPDYRLAGAEEAIRQMGQAFEQAIKQYEPTSSELAARSLEAHTRAHELASAERGRLPGKEIAEALRLFARWRYQHLVLKQVVNVYTALRAQLTDALREVAFCRERLEQMAERFSRPSSALARQSDSWLLPPGCKTAEEGAELLFSQVTEADIATLDRRLQADVEEHFTALKQVCISSSGLFPNLEGLLRTKSREFLAQRLGEVDVAGMFLTRYPSEAEARNALAQAHEEALPELGRFVRGVGADLAAVALPAGPAGEPLLRLIGKAVPDVEFLRVPSQEEIAFWRELSGLPLTELAQTGQVAEEAYRALLANPTTPPHSRVDVSEWLPVED
jgi:hypothetical protein